MLESLLFLDDITPPPTLALPPLDGVALPPAIALSPLDEEVELRVLVRLSPLKMPESRALLSTERAKFCAPSRNAGELIALLPRCLKAGGVGTSGGPSAGED